MKIRRARKSDIDDFIEFYKENNRYHARFEGGFTELSPSDIKDRKEKFLKVYNRKSQPLFFCEVKGKVIGQIWGMIRGKGKNKSGFINDIIVLEECRRKGYGRKMIKFMEDYFKKNGCKKSKLYGYSKNKPAMKTYLGVGYKKMQTVIQMEKDL